MCSCLAVLGVLALAGCPGSPPPPEPVVVADPTPDAAPPPDARPTIEQTLLARLADDQDRTVRGARLIAWPALQRFYRDRSGELVWSTRDDLDPRLGELRTALAALHRYALDPDHYHAAALGELIAAIEGQSAAADIPRAQRIELELLASDAFFAAGGHLVAGVVDPESLESDWKAVRRAIDMPAALDRALASGDIDGAIAALAPSHEDHRRLVVALARYRAIAEQGGWQPLEPARVRRGSRGSAVVGLARRLAVEGFGDGSATRFDSALARLLARYQRARGLPATGKLDDATRAALDTPVAARIQQIALNLERWRWLPDSLGERHVIVNVPAFELTAHEAGQEVFRSRVIVGRDYRRTPVFSGAIHTVVVNPHWTIPKTILLEDKLPEIRADPKFLTRQGIEVIDRKGEVVDPTSIDWTSFDPAQQRYRFRMASGSANPLGRIKFDVVNEFAVYLHDTNDRSLFKKGVRTFSSGCVRVDRPERMAAWVLDGTEGWDEGAIAKAIKAGALERIEVARPPTMHLLYWTAVADDDGALVLLPDVYGRDGKLADAIGEAFAPR